MPDQESILFLILLVLSEIALITHTVYSYLTNLQIIKKSNSHVLGFFEDMRIAIVMAFLAGAVLMSIVWVVWYLLPQ